MSSSLLHTGARRLRGLVAMVLPVALAITACADPECSSDDTVVLSAPALGFELTIDRFEAMRGDGDLGCSVSGASPWTAVSYSKAKSACEDAGKRLCTLDEWQQACRSISTMQSYPYGPAFDAQKCNVQATGVGTIEPTGARDTCVTLQQVADLSGNVREWVEGPSGPVLAGGSFASSQLDANCSAFIEPAGGADNYAAGSGDGFRCCSD